MLPSTKFLGSLFKIRTILTHSAQVTTLPVHVGLIPSVLSFVLVFVNVLVDMAMIVLMH